ncbi:VWA-like domain-containing protein [Mycobacterium sp. M26]|uniref:vWA domain-containing protein n=1 Tax=Mycobacterium sp. M26 TaxID=1762962 RepID=UPI00073F6E7F|nr:VWA-like domain-containing protein [Mycobacterium sp. M26]
MDHHKLAAAKLWLISSPPPTAAGRPDAPRDLVYLSQAIYALIPIVDDEVERLTCDEWWRIYINEEWFDSASVAEIGAELTHVTWHLLSEHAERARIQHVDRTTASAWERAADIAISHTLLLDKLKPPQLPTARSLKLPDACSAEEYFALISRLPPPCADGDGTWGPRDGCGSGADGLRRPNEFGPDADIGTVSKHDATEIRRRVAIEYEGHTASRGATPGDALRWVKRTLEPEIPWEPLLSAAVRRAFGWAAGRGEYTYTKPSRRSNALPGVVLPGQHRPVPRVSIIVDTSGSVDDTLLARALGEVDGALMALGVPGAQMTIYSVDAAIHTAQRIRNAKDAKLVGAGGTDMRLGFGGVQDERPRPDVVICFTDGDTPWPSGPPPGAAVIAAILGRRGFDLPPTPKWVTRVECVVDDKWARM